MNTGSLSYHRITPFIRWFVGTDGVIELAETLKLFWFLEDCIIYGVPYFKKELASFLTFELRTSEKGSAKLMIGNGNKTIKSIPYDFVNVYVTEPKTHPLKLFAGLTMLDEDKKRAVLMLPSEY